MRHLVLRFAALCAIVTAVSCAAVTYDEPQSGDRARVRFVVAAGERAHNQALLPDANAVVWGYTDENCNGESQWLYLLDGFSVNSERRQLGIPLWDFNPNAAKELYVATGSPLNVMFAGTTYIAADFIGPARGETVHCGVFVNAELTPNHDYELIYHSDRAQSCSIELNEIVTTGSGYERHLLHKFGETDRHSDGCSAAFYRH